MRRLIVLILGRYMYCRAISNPADCDPAADLQNLERGARHEGTGIGSVTTTIKFIGASLSEICGEVWHKPSLSSGFVMLVKNGQE